MLFHNVWLLIIKRFCSRLIVVKSNIREVLFFCLKRRRRTTFNAQVHTNLLIVCSEQLKKCWNVCISCFYSSLLDWPKANWLPVVMSESLMGVTRRIYRKSTNECISVPIDTTGSRSKHKQLLFKWNTLYLNYLCWFCSQRKVYFSGSCEIHLLLNSFVSHCIIITYNFGLGWFNTLVITLNWNFAENRHSTPLNVATGP